jgi:hypothetical protein
MLSIAAGSTMHIAQNMHLKDWHLGDYSELETSSVGTSSFIASAFGVQIYFFR